MEQPLNLRAQDEEVERLVDEITEVITSAGIRSWRPLLDTFAFSLATQVCEYLAAIRVISSSAAPVAGYPTARAAFETALDLLYLLSQPAEKQDHLAALAYVSEQLANWEMREEVNRAADIAELAGPAPPSPTLDQVLEEDARALDNIHPGQGGLIRAARRAAERNRRSGERHWSGLSRKKLIQQIGVLRGDPKFSVTLQSWYGVLAKNAHPGLRLGERIRFTSDEVRFVSKAEANDGVPLGTATAAGRFALLAVHELKAQHEKDPDAKEGTQ